MRRADRQGGPKSLAGARVHRRIAEKVGVGIELRDVFTERTIRNLAARMAGV
ncbi:hypothetical protein F5X71_17295 [Nocardia brasiliensis]|uniref:Carrier domain-containing protein n=1 Tax=Nocardia brasiliensis TaxID=37326 RepID=A0A6G9XSH2_NOCBR|nr:acyl carrier protein [Nocardia brasiliensis]QIS03846.1 hypothetical protein F5X71_17295 [Nocardia brasiliensis]